MKSVNGEGDNKTQCVSKCDKKLESIKIIQYYTIKKKMFNIFINRMKKFVPFFDLFCYKRFGIIKNEFVCVFICVRTIILQIELEYRIQIKKYITFKK